MDVKSVVDEDLMRVQLTDFPDMFVASNEVDGIMVENGQVFIRFLGNAQYWVTEHSVDELLNMIRSDQERYRAYEQEEAFQRHKDRMNMLANVTQEDKDKIIRDLDTLANKK